MEPNPYETPREPDAQLQPARQTGAKWPLVRDALIAAALIVLGIALLFFAGGGARE